MNMHCENLDLDAANPAACEKVLSICSAGVLETTITVPSRVGNQAPLLALHGISRNAAEITGAFAEVAETAGRIVVVPHFSAANWPVYQRITRRARPDKSLLSLFETLRAMDSVFDGPIDLFGFSGGAQLAHRFAMLYPEAVGDLYLGAAGWYTLPQSDVEYPYGLRDSENGSKRWSRLMCSGLHRYLRRDFTVYVGEHDTERDESLRQNLLVDEHQGFHRLERARSYVAALNSQQAELGLPCTARLEVLPGCDHRFSICNTRGAIARRVLTQL